VGDAAEDLLAFTSFPPSHWNKLWSTNPLERLHKEIKRRTDVVGCSRTRRRQYGWPGPCWSKPMTSGKSATAATSRRPPWPCVPQPPRR
jgi:putative transposase